MAKKKKNFRKGFRKNKRIKHPTYVVDEAGNLYQYIGITHSDSVKGQKNIPLNKNPNPEDNRKAYLRPIVEEDVPKNFGRTLKNWTFTKADKQKVQKIIDSQKKKK